MMERHALIERLALIRWRVRVRLAVYGGCAVVAGGFAAFLTCVTLDWLLWLPWALRVAGAVLFLAGFVWALWRWVVRPLRATLGLSEIADQLEQRFTLLADRLTSAVDFLQHPEVASAGLMRHVVNHTERMVEHVPLETALSIRPVVRQGAWCIAVTVVFLLVLLLAPGWAKTGAVRYLDPMGKVEWPHDVAIVPRTADVLVPMGESVTLRMSIARGFSETLRGVVHLREPDGAAAVLAMQRERDGTYSLRVDAVTRDMQYWFEAGDDSTQDRPAWIRVVRRPEVVEATVSIEPPPYASNASFRVLDLADGPVSAPVGGHATVRLRASKTIPAGSGSGLRLESGGLIPLEVGAEDGRELSARFEVRSDTAFRAEVRDGDGFENRGAAQYVIRAVPDVPPTVTVLDSAALVEVTPGGSVPLEVRVTDDFGIAGLELAAEQLGEGPAVRTSLSDRLRRNERVGGVEATASYTWSMAPLALAPGDVLTYRLIAVDNFAGADGQGQEGRSAAMRVRIISEVEFAIRMRSDLALFEKQLRQAVLDQKELLDQTQRLVAPGPDPSALDPAQRDAAARAASAQIGLLRNVRDLARRLFKLAEQMEQNRIETGNMHRHAAWLAEGLSHAANDPMRRAVEGLNRMLEEPDPEAQQASLAGAGEAQAAAVGQLEALLVETGQWGDFQSLTTKARDLLQRQESLRTRTAELGRSMLGRELDELNAEQRRQLKRTKREQEQVGDDIERLLARMRELRSDPGEDPAGAQAIESALRAAAAHDLTERVRRAAESIESNRTAAAAMDQRAVGDAIRKVIAALEERDARQLEELRKRVVDARHQLAELIDEQESLHAATREAGLLGHLEEDGQRAALGDEQRRLRRNASQLGREWSDQPRLVPASAAVKQAVQPMSDAEQRLGSNEPQPAAQAQSEALTLLHEALEILDEIARQTEEEAVRRTLAQIREDLQHMRDAQATINDDMGRLRAAMDAAGRMERAHAREASRLSREQAEVRTEVDGLLPELEKVVVYRWAVERVAEWMEATRRALYERNLGADTLVTAERIVGELDKLIDAIDRTAELPLDREFEESAAGDSGAAAAAAAKPVPTVAELLVLKTMQEDINDRSRQLGQSLDVEHATERQLRSLEMLGEDQREVRRLTELVTNRARQP